MYEELTEEQRVVLAIEYIARDISIPEGLYNTLSEEVRKDLGVYNGNDKS